MNAPCQLIILGASIRAAAQSAAAAGISAWGVDLFADRDAAPLGSAVAAESYPDGLFQIARQGPDAPWMYTGGVENFPEHVEILSRIRPLAGNGADTLLVVRDPLQWQGLAGQCGLAVAETLAQPPRSPQGYLRKRVRSTAGMGVVRAERAGGDAKDCRWQRRIEGRAGSSLFVSDGCRAARLGSLWQLPRADAPVGEFQYCGSWGPAALSTAALAALDRFAAAVTELSQLRGIWGLDFILADDGRLYPLEINPRWTAGAELLERALRRPLAADHLAACLKQRLPDVRRLEAGSPTTRLFGKRIVYARRRCQVTPRLDGLLESLRSQGAAADLPRRGRPLRRGQPLCTVLAAGVGEAELTRQLREREAAVIAAAGGG